MSWINENKFVASLIGVTAIISGGILFFGVSQSGVYEDKLSTYEDLKSNLYNISKAKPYPSAESLATRNKGIEDYKSAIDNVSQELQSYKPESLEALSPEEFSNQRVTMERELRTAFTTADIKIPSGCSFGFEKYSAGQPSADATSQLYFQLAAAQSLLESLVKSKPIELLNIRRGELPVENGVVAEKDDDNIYQGMPMELAFTGSEASVREFLKEMVSSEKYFYSIKSIRIQNQKQQPPSEQSVEFPVPEAAFDEGGDFSEFMEDEGAAESVEEVAFKATPGDRMLKQILGSELLEVHISFEALLIQGDSVEEK